MFRVCRFHSLITLVAATLVLSLGSTAHVLSKARHACCQMCGHECGHQHLVQKTIMVPMKVCETQLKTEIIKVTKERTQTYTVFKRVPEKRKYTRECCHLEDEIKTKTISTENCRRVQNPVIREDTVKVPVHEMFEGVKRQVICTECGAMCVESPCTCCRTTTTDEVRVQNCERQDVVFEVCKKDIDYCVKTPKFDEKVCAEETIYKLVPVEKTCKVMVCVPEIVKKPCQVEVTRMVAKKVWCCEACCQKCDAGHHGKPSVKEHLADAKKKLTKQVKHGKGILPMLHKMCK